VQGIIDLQIIKKIEKGLIINKLKYGVKSVKIIGTTRSYSWVLIKLDEGKNNHIRKIFKRLGFSVNKLIRIQYGPIKLSSLKSGDSKLISPFKLNLINL
jgi:23S rRNA pseudouridine2605 synthase